MYRLLVLTLFFSSMVFLAPFSAFADSSDEQVYYSSMSDEWKVSRAMIQLVRNEYRMALHITERMLACFTNDTKWFEENSRDFRDRIDLCETRMEQIRGKVKKQLPLMRIYLALSMKSEPYRPMGMLGAYTDSNLYQFPTDVPVDFILNEMLPESNNIAYPLIRHTFPTVDVAPLNAEELSKAIEILNTDLAWIRHKYGDTEPQKPATCFVSEKTFPASRTIQPHRAGEIPPERAVVFIGDGIGVGERSCYYDLYISSMFGGQVADKPWTKSVEGFPLLAYISDDNGSDESIIKALKKRIELTQNAKKDFEKRYYDIRVNLVPTETPNGIVLVSQESLVPKFELSYSFVSELFIYDSLADDIIKGNPGFKPAVEEGMRTRKNRELRRSLITVGAVFAAIPVCSNLFTGSIARGLCMLPFGLGLNGYMVYESETRLRGAVNDMLMSPNGLRVLNHVDSLNDYQFNRNLEWLMMPIGTGLIDLKRGFSAFLKSR